MSDANSTDVSGRSFLAGQVERELAAAVGAGHVTRDPGTLQNHAADWSWASKYLQYRDLPVPAADIAVSPGTTAEVERVVQIASDYRMPIVTRGGGSGTQGGTLAPYGGLSLDVSRLNRILDIDEDSLVVTAEAGLEGPVLEETLNERGLTLAHYPGSYHLGATLGGYLAARGSGVVSTKYGKAEDQVLQVEVVVPPGKTFKTLPVPSHAAGPDLLQVLVGSEGTLGVMTSVAMRIEHLPQRREFLSFAFPDVFSGIEAGRLIMTKRLRPSVIRLYDTADSVKLQDWVGTPFTGNLMVIMCDGDDELVDYETRAITALAELVGGRSLGPEVGEIWWEGKYEPYAEGKLPQPPVMYGTFDTVARFRDIPGIYRAKKELIETKFADVGVRYTAHFSHWFPWGTMIYDRFFIEEPPEDPAEALALHDRLWDAGVLASIEHGGTINEHHGVGQKLGRFMRPQYGKGFDVLRAMKHAWDPDGIMNPGKLGFGPPAGGRWP